MSQTYNRGKPRFSRRQVTKRTFNLLGSPNALHNVQSDTKARRSTQNEKISKSKQNDVVDTLNKKSKSYRGKGNKGSSESSNPAALLKEQKENEASTDPYVDYGDIDKNVEEVDHTPRKQQKLDGVDYSPAPGDVSVSFLASTPKPGRPQLSRRRPMTPVTEALVRPQVTGQNNVTDNHTFKSQKVNLLEEIEDKQQIGRDSPRKRSPFKQASSRGSPQKRIAGSSIDEKIASIVKSRLEKKRNSLDVKNKHSINEIDVKVSKSKAENKSVADQRVHLRTKSGEKQQKMSVPVQNVPVSKTRQVHQRSKTNNTRDNDTPDLPEAQTSMRNRSSKLTGNTKSQSIYDASCSERPDTRGNLSRTRLRNNVRSNDDDVTVRDDTSKGRLASQQRKSAVNRKLQSLSRKIEVASTSADDMSAIDQTMMVWETDSQKRGRSDLIDLDVVLSAVTETLEARMDVYDTDEEQSVVRLLEKYLTNDITHMIQGVQTVIGLQTKIRRSGQSIKQKQKSLMALQKERMEKEEKCEPLKKSMKDNENLTTINQFLKDLSNVIEKC